MQIDMHYYGTYCLARAAGIKRDSSHTVAYAAEFVDDNVAHNVDDHEDGSKIFSIPTAHHAGDLSNREPEDQRFIWVPFHFLPGNEGSSFTERLICRKDSTLAQEMVKNHLSNGHKAFGLELLGITAHVYADTFAHYDFSGVSSRFNRVDGSTFELTQDEAVVEAALGQSFGAWMSKHGGLLSNIRSGINAIAESYSGSLGHGAVSNYPDLPFLQWKFTFENGTTAYHDNPATFLEGAEKMYNMFKEYAKMYPEHAGPTSVPWDVIKAKVAWIYEQEGDKSVRSDIWRAASIDGDFGVSEKIPEYDADQWNDQCNSLEDMEDGADALDLDVHKFYRAASYHVHYVLRELLPSHGLMVV